MYCFMAVWQKRYESVGERVFYNQQLAVAGLRGFNRYFGMISISKHLIFIRRLNIKKLILAKKRKNLSYEISSGKNMSGLSVFRELVRYNNKGRVRGHPAAGGYLCIY